MLRNYLTIAFRTLKRRPSVTAINVVGLAVGLAACLLIGLWVERELSYDDFHPEADRVVRVALDYRFQDRAIRSPQVPYPLGSTLRREVPEVETVTQFRYGRSVMIRREDQAFTDNAVALADSSFFDVFGGFELLHGSRASVLDGTNGLVVTASAAERMFGRTDVVGETLQIVGRTRPITGVMADVPETSHLQPEVVGALGEVDSLFLDNWTGYSFYTYAKLAEGTSTRAFEANLDAIAEKYGVADVQERFEVASDQFRYEFFAQPLTSIHLHSDLQVEIEPNGSITSVYAFSAIGIFILLIACINFMNLATARASERATEVGMRKTFGAGRPQLAGQFLGEAILTTAAATILALAMAALALPTFNDVAGTSMGLGVVLQPDVLFGGLVLVLIVGGLAGSYPAFALSRFAPAAVLKASGYQGTGGRDRRLRQGLVIVQFAISIALIVGTLVAWEQFSYVQNKRLGLEKERVVEIEHADDLGERQAAFVSRLRQQPGVAAASAGDALFQGASTNAFVPNQEPASEARTLNVLQVGIGFVELMKIGVAAGRTFDPARPADSTAVLLNEAAARGYGWAPQEALGQALRTAPDDPPYTVVGVVDDFHYQSMRTRVEPLALFLENPIFTGSDPGSVYVRLASGETSEVLSELKALWGEMAGQAPFQYSFLDQTYGRLHRDIQRAGQLFGLFAGLAVIVACLGLFGLATYTVQRRAKEIGIRKALGATAMQVVGLLSKQFLRLVAIAGVVALPVAYVAMQRWLEDFAYRTTVGVDILLGTMGLAGTVALLAIGTHALQAARLDPATTLRDE